MEPVYVQIPLNAAVSFATANAGLVASNAVTSLFVADADGATLDGVHFAAQGAVTAGRVGVFIQPQGAGWLFLGDVVVSATTPSSTVAGWSGFWQASNSAPIYLSPGTTIGVGTINAETFTAFGIGGQYSRVYV